MEFPSQLTQAVLLKRYKRFLAEIILNNQEHRIIYCPNTGTLSGCDVLGSRVWFSHTKNPRRRFPDTWELVEVDGGNLVCVNPQHVKPLLLEGIASGTISELQGYVPHAEEGDFTLREGCDLLLEKTVGDGKIDKAYVVMRAVVLGDEVHRGFYPDTATPTGIEQLKSLIRLQHQGARTVLMYCVLHTGISRVFPADHIDPDYGDWLRRAALSGVEIVGYRVDISFDRIFVASKIEVCVPARRICASRQEKSR